MNPKIYALGLALVNRPKLRLSGEITDALQKDIETILTAERARGVSLAVFDGDSVRCLSGGEARFLPGTKVTRDTYFRAASVSKFVTAYGALLLNARGALDLNADVGDYLGYLVRNPKFPDVPITLRQLLSHTSSLTDGVPYLSALQSGAPCDSFVNDCFAPCAPGARFAYSNFGAGLIGCAMERAAGMPFDDLMRETVFAPCGVDASYHPQRISGTLADAWRLFPPSKSANFDALARQKRPLSENKIDAKRDYLLAHGSLCVTAPGLAKLTQSIAADKEIFDRMKTPIAPFGERDRTLSEGLGTFIYREKPTDAPLFGHQGLAYGAVHGAFTDGLGHGFAVLTSAVSEQRQGVLTRMNRALCALFFREGVWKGL